MASTTKPPTSAGHENRQHVRYELFASVELKQADETWVLAAHNLSVGGVFLASGGHELKKFTVGSTQKVMVFDASDETIEPIRTTAVVVRHDNDGMAMMWNSGSTSDASRIATMLEKLRPRR